MGLLPDFNELQTLARQFQASAATDGHFCHRGFVFAALISVKEPFPEILGTAYNSRHESLGKCDCNDGVNTAVESSNTCKAIHAEIKLLVRANLYNFSTLSNLVLFTTRPPCKNCIAALLETPIQTIYVTDQWHDRDGSFAIWLQAGRKWHTVPTQL